MMSDNRISYSVGAGGVNQRADVKKIQKLLIAKGISVGERGADSYCGPDTILAIKKFQAEKRIMVKPDGRIDKDGKTWGILTNSNPNVAGNASVTPLATAAVMAPAASPVQLPVTNANLPTNLQSGTHWCPYFPTSRDVADLSATFRPDVERFLTALRNAGATVGISATRRPRQRALLMNVAWRITHMNPTNGGHLTPQQANTFCENANVGGQTISIPINWVHSSVDVSVTNAENMVNTYAMSANASLTSNHFDGNAIDMNVTWTGTLRIADASGQIFDIGAPRNNSNTTLHRVSRSYGVIKKVYNDPPHWSTNGN
jgi:peptidoglycan hydrolase-like protein with peptidoglycan-binding domain